MYSYMAKGYNKLRISAVLTWHSNCQQFLKRSETTPLNIHRAGDARNQLFVAGNDQINVPARGHFVGTLQL
jgi:hypothetical protein